MNADTRVMNTPTKDFADKTNFERGMQHYREGIPRRCNPCYVAALNNGARKPMQRPSVVAWFAGWDTAKAAS